MQMAAFSPSEDSAIDDEESFFLNILNTQNIHVNATFSEDEDAENNSSDLLWTSFNSENDKRPDPFPEFLATPGRNPSIRFAENVKDVMFFGKLFLTDNLLAHIRHFVHSRAQKRRIYMNENDMPNFIANWKNVTTNEIKKVFGIIFYMAIDKKPKTYMRMTTGQRISCTAIICSQLECLTRASFCEILKYFRVCDYAETNQVDPISRK